MRIELHDFSMEYDERGSGIPLLLVHGFPFNRHMWEPQVQGLSDIARIITPDLRGHGDSEFTRGSYTMDKLAGDLYEFLTEIGVTQPVIIGGLSMGGYITFAFYRKYPERVAAVILASTRATADTEEGKLRREEMAALALESGSGAVAEGMLPKIMSPKTYENKPELVEKMKRMMEKTSPQGIAGALLGMKERPDSTGTLQQIDKPTLVIHGADDQLAPVQEAESMQAILKTSHLQVIQGAGHLPNLEQPEQFNRTVREFLGSL